MYIRTGYLPTICAVFSLLLTISVTADDKLVRLTSLDWPPYSGQALQDQGASIAIAKAAFAAMGHRLEVSIYPWNRSVALASEENSIYAGYFPEYHAQDIAEDFIFSDPIGSGPLGFAELKSNPVQWQVLSDLNDYRIGTVQGYVNTADFDEMAKNKELITYSAISDVNNLKKLTAGRLDLVVIDRFVMEYLLVSDNQLSKKAHLIQFNQRLLEDKKLYICFKKNEQGKALAKVFNQGLKTIDIDSFMHSYLQEKAAQ